VKIGQFAKSNDVSVDTIRHYMDLGLIVPEKRGGQYSFDDRCLKDLELILEFKSMDFQLNEIKMFFLYKNFGQLTNYEEDPYYQSLFKEKLNKIDKEISELFEIKDKLHQKLKTLSEKQPPSNNMTGIHIRLLDLFQCLKCHKQLTLQDGIISSNQIVDGKLGCECGETYTIQSGILLHNQPTQSISNIQLENHINEYIQLTDSSYLENINKGLHWTKRKINHMDLHHKVVLELGSGIGFFLRNIYQDLPEDCLYIAVDHDFERHRFLKGLLESTNLKRNVLFICTDFLDIPIQNSLVDLLVDHSGTSNYSFEHQDFLLRNIDSLIKPDGYLLGSYFAFKNFSSHSKIAVEFRDNFRINKIQNHIAELNYQLLDERTSPVIDKGGIYENFFVKGEEVFTYSVWGRKVIGK
jgi:DNA-binding transcriptional MerR regulator/SAM-dependent methyltransferase